MRNSNDNISLSMMAGFEAKEICDDLLARAVLDARGQGISDEVMAERLFTLAKTLTAPQAPITGEAALIFYTRLKRWQGVIDAEIAAIETSSATK